MSTADDAVRLSQSGARVRFGWGPQAVRRFPATHVVVVDVLRFTTAVDVAVSHGARVHPYRWRDGGAGHLAAETGAHLADGSSSPYSLSPASLAGLNPGDAVVLPSPNGSTCAALAHERGAVVLAACLRNAAAVAAWLDGTGAEDVLVVACGEQWPDGAGLRPALEDELGAAAVVAQLGGSRSAEADAAARLWTACADGAADLVRGSASAAEARSRGWHDDLELACRVGASDAVPLLLDGAFSDGSRR
ncbi:putative lipoprotein [Beutenbergia cavernae DSM 12333]|uniref:Probable 2-phosphosulfolactate phosphatase n=1 Tax=Beutenbergia cavernae (strain ATCC BAA-8 / DSM 12333 / CCUG 43141 / JCM 11478 / NBRC 16432 / NCIMB 13614 / HKI 0122) TaxID=471853 RepID=C5C5M8_BEUC1|nr:2-phosphosulfolactate phosphatase [Beutenbergia cavernae]ACQ80219.1 putative lipoprotein [Beutenbergia cavernae DSM 12333]